MRFIRNMCAIASAALFITVSAAAYAKDCHPSGKLVKLDLGTFIDAQGSMSSFFPGFPDYQGWTDGAFTTFALIDYAGLANKSLAELLGTDVRGSVTARTCQGDSGVEVKVTLLTKNALGFAQCIQGIINNGFADTPTIFGSKAADVAQGSEPALGHSAFDITFRMPSAGNMALPDLRTVFDNIIDYSPVEMSFSSITFGKCANGTDCVLHVQEKARSTAQCLDADASNDGECTLAFSKEVIDIVGPDTPSSCPTVE